MPKKISELNPNDKNPRLINYEALRSLRQAMQEFGDLGGIVFNRRTQRLVGGHQRVKTLDPAWTIRARKHVDDVGTVAVGYIHTPFGDFSYREVDWPEDKELAANIAANNHGGEFDDAMLREALAELTSIGTEDDMTLTGFSANEISDILAQMPEEFASHSDAPSHEEETPAKCRETTHFMVQAILNTDEYRRWTEIKKGLTDKAYILEVINNVA